MSMTTTSIWCSWRQATLRSHSVPSTCCSAQNEWEIVKNYTGYSPDGLKFTFFVLLGWCWRDLHHITAGISVSVHRSNNGASEQCHQRRREGVRVPFRVSSKVARMEVTTGQSCKVTSKEAATPTSKVSSWRITRKWRWGTHSHGVHTHNTKISGWGLNLSCLNKIPT